MIYCISPKSNVGCMRCIICIVTLAHKPERGNPGTYICIIHTCLRAAYVSSTFAHIRYFWKYQGGHIRNNDAPHRLILSVSPSSFPPLPRAPLPAMPTKTGYEPFLDHAVNPAHEVAVSLNGTCDVVSLTRPSRTVRVCYEGVSVAVSPEGSSWTARALQETPRRWDGIIHLVRTRQRLILPHAVSSTNVVNEYGTPALEGRKRALGHYVSAINIILSINISPYFSGFLFSCLHPLRNPFNPFTTVQNSAKSNPDMLSLNRGWRSKELKYRAPCGSLSCLHLCPSPRWAGF